MSVVNEKKNSAVDFAKFLPYIKPELIGFENFMRDERRCERLFWRLEALCCGRQSRR
jgi:hypothetical protein